MKKQDLYMHYMTGSVDTEEEWIALIDKEELELAGVSTAQELWENYISKGIFYAVEDEEEENL